MNKSKIHYFTNTNKTKATKTKTALRGRLLFV